MSLTALQLVEAKMQTSDHQGGFTLLELAVAITLVGLLAGGALLCLNVWSENKLREENQAYMQEVKRALLIYAKVNKKLPMADTNSDGIPDLANRGNIPYAVLGVRPHDVWGRQLQYSISRYMNDNTQICNTLVSLPTFSTGFSFMVRIWDNVPSGTIFCVAAAIISAGPKDADNKASPYSPFDEVSGRGSNTNPNTPANLFVRSPPTASFDDMVDYIEPLVLYSYMGCGGAVTPAP